MVLLVTGVGSDHILAKHTILIQVAGLVDIPPGTRRVEMDGIGGGRQEISWQRYNGARRSRFIADGNEYDAYPDFDGRPRQQSLPPPPPPAPEPEPLPPPPKEEKSSSTSLEISIRERDRGGPSTEIVKREKKPKEMWTEVTKDLVIKGKRLLKHALITLLTFLKRQSRK